MPDWASKAENTYYYEKTIIRNVMLACFCKFIFPNRNR